MSNYREWKESKREYKMEKRRKRHKSQLVLLAIILSIGLPLVIIVGVTKGSENNTAPIKHMTDSTEIKKEFDTFKTKILDESTKMLENEATFEEFMNTYSSGQVSKVDAYEYAKDYKDVIFTHRENIESIKLADTFPEKLTAHLTEGKSKIIDGLSMKSTALSSFMEYLDDGKTSQLAEYKEYSPLYLAGLKAGMEKVNVVDKVVNPKDKSTGRASN